MMPAYAAAVGLGRACAGVPCAPGRALSIWCEPVGSKRDGRSWEEPGAADPGTGLRSPSQDLVRSVLDRLAAGMAAYSARQTEQSLDDLTDAAAASDMAAFLGTTTSTGALA